ncbi:hypothetical protein SADUNF_Sadunf05G0161100 [Salix dunnii]|uniref:Uncharacterized protein n=1 Tax=Salix dunnii TaxID=1413687 RepID=A0A835KBQ3_9ROSI|nr:hypothetical protein SADUNF_Sadunf05G0161100 [Salix dunnii]
MTAGLGLPKHLQNKLCDSLRELFDIQISTSTGGGKFFRIRDIHDNPRVYIHKSRLHGLRDREASKPCSLLIARQSFLEFQLLPNKKTMKMGKWHLFCPVMILISQLLHLHLRCLCTGALTCSEYKRGITVSGDLIIVACPTVYSK